MKQCYDEPVLTPEEVYALAIRRHLALAWQSMKKARELGLSVDVQKFFSTDFDPDQDISITHVRSF